MLAGRRSRGTRRRTRRAHAHARGTKPSRQPAKVHLAVGRRLGATVELLPRHAPLTGVERHALLLRDAALQPGGLGWLDMFGAGGSALSSRCWSRWAFSPAQRRRRLRRTTTRRSSVSSTRRTRCRRSAIWPLTSARAAAVRRRSVRAREYLKSILDGLGFQTQIYSFPITGNRAVAQISSPNATLPNGPHWQFSSSTFGSPDRYRTRSAARSSTRARAPPRPTSRPTARARSCSWTRARTTRPHDAGQQTRSARAPSPSSSPPRRSAAPASLSAPPTTPLSAPERAGDGRAARTWTG